MADRSPEFRVFKKTLSNGMKVVTRPIHHVPRVEAQIWYNVGSKHEDAHEKGMAHLIEHMLFKGTNKLSESDINLITHKLTGYTNAFTSHDTTSFIFRLPSNAWKHALSIFADCMENARFDSQMLCSEVKAVIEELRMYRDDFQSTVIQSLIGAIFPEHPYHYPIIGSKYDLAHLERDTLFKFYKKHYHPANATLIIAGDVEPEEVFQAAEEMFGHIPASTPVSQDSFYFEDDIISKTVTLYRQVATPWCCFAYTVPGLQDQKNHLLDIASLILGLGRSSRLYKRLVEQEQIAADVECFTLDFVEKGIFGITVYPIKAGDIPTIEKIINEEIAKLTTGPIEDWEFTAAQKKVSLDYTNLLESMEKQATLLGSFMLATDDPTSLERYFNNIQNLTKNELQDFFARYLSTSKQHKGYLLPIPEKDLPLLSELQQKSDALEKVILEKHHRTSPVEPGKLVDSIQLPPLSDFHYPQPQEFMLENGLTVLFHNNPLVPQVSCILEFKANSYYDPENRQGLFNLLLEVLTDHTAKYPSDAFHKLLETNGISLSSTSQGVVIRCLSEDLGQALHLLGELLTNPSFDENTIEKIKQQLFNEITEYWDNPLDFVDQLAKDHIYQNHPYHKNSMGSLESIKAITADDLATCYKTLISPQGAIFSIVGDLSAYDLPTLIHERLGIWNGNSIPSLDYPTLAPGNAQILTHPLNRDQVVLAFVTPTITRTDPSYLLYVLLDTILTGGSGGSMSSRLYQLREQTGLFYAIGGSLVHGAREEPGMMSIKTIVSADKVDEAQKLIMETIANLQEHGITQDEFTMAKNLLLSSLVDYFEANMHMAYTFSFLKKYNLSFNLFDKQLAALSIIKIEDVNLIAQKLCKPEIISVIRVGRVKK